MTPELNEKQTRIYEGLKQMGELVANFYIDAVNLTLPECKLASKANLIAHLAREIDGSIRDIFSPAQVINQTIKQFKGTKWEKSNHFISILSAIGKTDVNNSLANKWLGIANNFHRISHRDASSLHGPSTNPNQIIELWNNYEDVLFQIVGSFLSLTNRLDNIINTELPEKGILKVLKNLLSNPQNAWYFFSKLENPLWINSLAAEGYFEPECSPKVLKGDTMPIQWPALKFLVKISRQAINNEKDLLVSIIYKIINAYRFGEIKLHPYTVHDIAEIIINIKDLGFGEIELEFFKTQAKERSSTFSMLLNSTLGEELPKKLIYQKDEESLNRFLNYYFGFWTREDKHWAVLNDNKTKPTLQIIPYTDKFYIKFLGQKWGKEIVKILGLNSFLQIIEIIRSTELFNYFSLSSFSLPSIEPSSQSRYSEDWEAALVYFIRDNAQYLEIEQLGQLIDHLINSEAIILRRLGIHLIRINFVEFSNKWWEFIKQPSRGIDLPIHEPYLLIKDHSHIFNDLQIIETIEWIEKITASDYPEPGEKALKFSAYRIRRWLTGINPSSIISKDLIEQKVNKCKEMNPANMSDHPEFDSYSQITYGPDLPIDSATFVNFTVEEQANYLKNFQPINDFDTSTEGLADLLKFAITNNPVKYLFKLDLFLTIETQYLNSIISGFNDAFRNNNCIDFNFILDFIENTIINSRFDEIKQEKFDYKKWYASAIGQFFKTLCHAEESISLQALDVERITKIVLLLISKESILDDSEEIQNGFMNHILNCAPGILYGALIEIINIWHNKSFGSGENEKWPNSIEEIFTQKLMSSNLKDKEYSIILGLHLPLIFYIDKEWVIRNINVILDQKNSKHYNFRIHSLFANYYLPSKDLYCFFKDQNIFNKALDHFTEDNGSLNNIMYYGLLEWKFWGIDPENEGIIYEIFQKNISVHYRKLVEVIVQKGFLSREDILYIWNKIAKQHDLLPDKSMVYSVLINLFSLINALDEEVFALLNQLIKQLPDESNAYDILRKLYSIFETNIELSGKLVSLLFERKLVSAFNDHDLMAIVENCYNDGLKVLGDEICINVTETGYLGLKEIYNQHN